jgi:hypothetical protein
MSTSIPFLTDFSEFGQYGPEFESLQRLTDQQLRLHWDRKCDELGFPQLDAALLSLDRSGFLFLRLKNAMKFNSIYNGTAANLWQEKLLTLWEQFRMIFSPPLRPGAELLEDTATENIRIALQETIEQVENSDSVLYRRMALNKICCGPFRNDEMRWIRKRYRNVLEFAAGSAYLAGQIQKRGRRVVAIEIDDKQIIGPGGLIFPWARSLLKKNRLIIGGIEQIRAFAKHRAQLTGQPIDQALADWALLLGFPPTESPIPWLALRDFGYFGGRIFLFKIGRFGIAPRFMHSTTLPNYLSGLCRALTDGGWREISDPKRPGWICDPGSLDNNNLLAFERQP